jgi:hypothetical protein
VTKRLASPGVCLQPDHGHVILARRLPLDLDAAIAERWVTLWLCPVRHSLSAIVEDGRAIAIDRQPTGDLLDRL